MYKQRSEEGEELHFPNLFPIFVIHTASESVNVFSKSERRKFDFDKRIELTSLHRHIPAIWRGTVAYFVVKVSYDLLFQNKFSAPRFLFFVLVPSGVRGGHNTLL